MPMSVHLQPSLIIQRFAERAGFPGWLYEGTPFEPGRPLPEFIEIETGIRMIANAGRSGDLAVTLPYAVNSFRAGTLSALLVAFEHAPTLGEALTMLAEVGGLRNGLFRFATFRRDGLTALHFLPVRPQGEAALLLNEPTVFNYFGLIRDMRLGDAQGMVGKVMHGQHSMSDWLWPDPHMIQYAQATTSLVMPSSWEGEPNPRFDPDIWHLSRSRCDKVGAALSQAELLFTIRSDMQRALRQTGQLPTLSETARNRGVSPRTLVRYLKTAGSSFRELHEDMQKARAAELLSLPGARVHLVAEQLGFSDSSSFTRSFRRWFGTCPSTYVHSGSPPTPGETPMMAPSHSSVEARP